MRLYLKNIPANKIRKIVFFTFFLCNLCYIRNSLAQNVVSLETILSQVINSSYAVKTAEHQKKIAFHSYEFYKSQLKPNITVMGDLPNYNKTSFPVVQPNGNISFQSITQANSSFSAFASQLIPSTGGTVFVNSDLQRFDDFSTRSNQYNGIPVRAGIFQPLKGYNPWKFEKNIQKFNLKESELTYNIKIEEALGVAVNLYFNILIAKQNLEIAKTNQSVNENLLRIIEEKLALGKVSKDEKLQLEIELNNAKFAVSSETSQLETAISLLYTFLGLSIPDIDTEFTTPNNQPIDGVDTGALISNYKKNRPEIFTYQKEISKTKQDISKAKFDHGMQVNLEASIGFAKGADSIDDVYIDPFDEQKFNLRLMIPILDWGKRKAAIKQIEVRKQDLEEGYKQRFLEIENSIKQNANRFTRLQTEIKLLKEIMEKGEERFEISNNRYILGNIDITNLTLAQREKDQAKRTYINALKLYWTTYYQLRALSGFDVIKNKKIIY